MEKITALAVLASIFVCVPNLYSQDALFNVFNDMGLPAATSQGASSLSQITTDDNWSMGTAWTPQETYDETDVFHTELRHRSADQNWDIRIGKGGQLYSWNLEGTGELIPPQGHNSGNSPWVDDVILQTWRDSENYDLNAKLDGVSRSYANTFVHGAGMYIHPEMDPLNYKPFYDPMLAEKFSSADRSYKCINWGVIPTPSINRADILLYSNYRHLGDGVLEVTYYAYNYGENTYDDNAGPWAMLRNSIFPNTIRSLPQGNGFESWGEGVYPIRFNLKDQGGWVAKTGDQSTDLTMSIVHGLDRHNSEPWMNSSSFCSSGLSGATNSTRDITIFTAVHRSEVGPGTGFFWRYYLVLGTQEEVASKSYDLVVNMDYGPIEFTESSSELLPLYQTTVSGQQILTATKPNANAIPVAATYAMPVKNSVPLILMKDNANGQYYLSTDPYAICGKWDIDLEGYTDRHVYQPYDDKTEWVALLGYLMPADKAVVTKSTTSLATLTNETYRFIAGEKYASNELLIRTDDSSSENAILEAEDATIESASVKNDDEASNIAYVDGNGGFNLNFNTDLSGTYKLNFRIKSPTGSRSMGVFVNGEKIGTLTTSLSRWNHKNVIATLPLGTTTIELRDTEGTAELDVDYLSIEGASEANMTTIEIQEMETGFCSVDGIIENDYEGHTGFGYANTVNRLGNGINWEINGAAGTYTFNWRYASPVSRPAKLIVNETLVAAISFPSTGSWSNYGNTVEYAVSLAAGIKTLRLEASGNSGLANIDKMVISGPSVTSANCTQSPKQVKEQYGTLQIYPNPIESSFSVSQKLQEAKIYSLNGQLITKFTNHQTSFDVSNLPAGIYIFELSTASGEKFLRKIIKK